MPAQIDKSRLPAHVGIIMDGNGRWAQKRNLARSMGHKEGLESARRILTAAAELGIKYVTLYTFSTENWKRTQEEVGFLMGLVTTYLRAEVERYMKDNIRLLHLGDMNGLPADVQKEINDAVAKTSAQTGMTVVLALNYGGRDEIVRAVKRLAAGGANLAELTEAALARSLDAPELPDVDLLIRTGGEQRISNFLIWQSAYAELSFSDTLWPDYSKEEFLQAVADFQNRNRRFGGVK